MDDTRGEQVQTPLAAWTTAIDRALAYGETEMAARLARVALRRLPRYLALYSRLLEIAWRTRRWDEGEEWGRRLLQADPGNALAWRALAQAAEQRNRRAQAQTIWQRAFEVSPYDAEIRAGLSRTSLDPPSALAYNAACLAALYLRGLHWDAAARSYRSLVQADRRRVDFQVCLAVALWQSDENYEAYALARHLVSQHPHLLMAWVVLQATGDENDRALAANPIATMDPDGEFAAETWDIPRPERATIIAVRAEEAALLDELPQDDFLPEEPLPGAPA